jgi:hypothetical protein
MIDLVGALCTTTARLCERSTAEPFLIANFHRPKWAFPSRQLERVAKGHRRRRRMEQVPVGCHCASAPPPSPVSSLTPCVFYSVRSRLRPPTSESTSSPRALEPFPPGECPEVKHVNTLGGGVCPCRACYASHFPFPLSPSSVAVGAGVWHVGYCSVRPEYRCPIS